MRPSPVSFSRLSNIISNATTITILAIILQPLTLAVTTLSPLPSIDKVRSASDHLTDVGVLIRGVTALSETVAHVIQSNAPVHVGTMDFVSRPARN